MVEIPIDDGDEHIESSGLKQIVEMLCSQLNITEEQLWMSFRITFISYAGMAGKKISDKIIARFEHSLAQFISGTKHMDMENIFEWIRSYSQSQ